jgi:AcrR family transcriptional regulator
MRGKPMDTKHRILDEALTLFSEKGYANVYVSDIAERVGIKAPSLYKHYRNKRAIFDAIIDEMIEIYDVERSVCEEQTKNFLAQLIDAGIAFKEEK